jgi:hypothetical protein
MWWRNEEFVPRLRAASDFSRRVLDSAAYGSVNERARKAGSSDDLTAQSKGARKDSAQIADAIAARERSARYAARLDRAEQR